MNQSGSDPLDALTFHQKEGLEGSEHSSYIDVDFNNQLQQSMLLQEVSDEIRQTLDTDIIFQIAVDKVQTLLQVDRVAIYQFDFESGYTEGVFVAEKVRPIFTQPWLLGFKMIILESIILPNINLDRYLQFLIYTTQI